MKVCNRCQHTKELSFFTKDKAQIDGFDRRCRNCKAANYAKIDKNERKEWRKKYYETHREQELKACEDYKLKHLEYYRTYISEYYKMYPEKGAAKTAKYRATKLHATPIWITEQQLEEMQKVYENCPEGHHVDHIIPLQGKEVRGLHVPWNLQYLPAKINQRKSNRVVLQEWSTPS